MRALIRNAIVSDPTLESLGVVASGVLSGDMDTPAERPFLNLRWGQVNPGMDVVNISNLVIWVHDSPGDYEARINLILLRLREVITDLVGVQHTTGWLTAAEWSGDSGDLFDDGHGTITRTTSFTLVGSGQ